MINFEGLKEFDVAALGQNAAAPTGRPCELPVAKIHPDPDNIRNQYSEEAIAELAETIRIDGLIQAIIVRPHPTLKHAYMISYGERRWRAFCALGRATIPAVIDADFDPYRQAIENLQREALTPLQIAAFVSKRELAGDSRTKIAKRLGKSKSFISELARLAQAPKAVRDAVDTARIDTRTAYLLACHFPKRPDKVASILKGEAPLNRIEVAKELRAKCDAHGATLTDASPESPMRQRAREYGALAVLLEGRMGIMSFEAVQPSNQATIQFADGSQQTVHLSKISLKHWVRQ